MTHLGWSSDSMWLRTNCDARELRYWDSSGAAAPESFVSSEALITAWHTGSTAGGGALLYSHETEGAHGDDPAAGGADLRVTAIARSHSEAEPMLAVGDDFQTLRLLPFPCSMPAALSSTAGGGLATGAIGHASGLSAVRFSHNDRYVITAGGEDLCVLVWRLDPAQESAIGAGGSTAASLRDGTGSQPQLSGGEGAHGTISGVTESTGFTAGNGNGAVPSGGVLGEEGEEDEGDDSDVEVIGLGGLKSKPRREGKSRLFRTSRTQRATLTATPLHQGTTAELGRFMRRFGPPPLFCGAPGSSVPSRSGEPYMPSSRIGLLDSCPHPYPVASSAQETAAAMHSRPMPIPTLMKPSVLRTPHPESSYQRYRRGAVPYTHPRTRLRSTQPLLTSTFSSSGCLDFAASTLVEPPCGPVRQAKMCRRSWTGAARRVGTVRQCGGRYKERMCGCLNYGHARRASLGPMKGTAVTVAVLPYRRASHT